MSRAYALAWQVLEEVRHAPRRRLDNIITRLYDSTRLLAMHATVLEAVRKEYSSARVSTALHGLFSRLH